MALPPIEIRITGDDSRFKVTADATTGRLARLREVSDRVSRNFAVMGDRLTKVGRKMSYASAGIMAAGAGLLALAKRGADAADKINDLSAAAGVGAEYFQEMTFALEQAAAMSDEETGAALTRLTRVIGEAKEGSKGAAEALGKLGFSQSEIASGTITTEAAMDRFVTTVGAMKTPTEASALAVDLLGKSGAKAGAMLAGTGDRVGQLRDRAQALGVVMSERATKAAGDFNDKLDEIRRQSAAAAAVIGAELMPLFTDYLFPVLQERVIPAAVSLSKQISEWVGWFLELPGPVRDAVAAIAGGFAVGGPVLLAVGAFTSMLGAAVAATGPIGLLIGLATVATVAWVKWGDDIRAAVGGAIDWITTKFQTFKDMLQGVIDKAVEMKNALLDAVGLGEGFGGASGAGAIVTNRQSSGVSGNGGSSGSSAAASVSARQGRSTGAAAGGTVGGGMMLGAGIINGMVLGAMQTLEENRQGLAEIFGQVVQIGRETLGIHSPSTVFAEIGQNIGQGLANGIAASAALVRSAVGAVTRPATEDAENTTQSILSSMGTLFSKSKTIARALALIDIGRGLASALTKPWPQNLVAFAQTAAAGKSALATISSASAGGGGAIGGAAGGTETAGAAPPRPHQVSVSVQGAGADLMTSMLSSLADQLRKDFGDSGYVLAAGTR